MHLIARSPRVLCCDSHASTWFLNPLESLARSNSLSWRLEKTPPPLISSRNSRAIHIFRVRFLGDTLLGVGTKLSSKFHPIWTRFALDSRFGTEFSGFSGHHRSDRLARPVRPVRLFLNFVTGQTGPLYRSDRSVPEQIRFEKFSRFCFRFATRVFCFEIACS